MKKRVLIAVLCLAALFAAVLPAANTNVYAANHSAARPAFLDKTRFVAHMGLAFYAFHHYVWVAYRKGEFKSGAPHRTLNLIKAGVALLFAYHEAKTAYTIAQRSNSKTLHVLTSPISKLMNTFYSVQAKWKRGNFSPSDATSLNNTVSGLASAAHRSGFGAIPDIPVGIPGL